jgi:hypothetical protein
MFIHRNPEEKSSARAARKNTLIIFLFSMTVSFEFSAGAIAATTAYQNFVSVCTEAFGKSRGEEGRAIGRDLCVCAADQSKQQGVSVEALVRETKRISENSGVQIKDKGLLAALQSCLIDAAHH